MHPDFYRYGFHRVLSPKGQPPQSAWSLDASLPIHPHEILIKVDQLHLDSTSFRQLYENARHDVDSVQKAVLALVEERGKMHNPITNSGGMLLGEVIEMGSNYHRFPFHRGDRIASLVSLTLTPLHLDQILNIDPSNGQMKVKGHAIFFESSLLTLMPSDLPESVALAIFDICGAPALVKKHCQKNQQILLVGAGKSAKLSAAALREVFQNKIFIAALDSSKEALQEMQDLDLVDEVFVCDATSLVGAQRELVHVVPTNEGLMNHAPTSKAFFDLPLSNRFDRVINLTNVPGTEMLSLLAVKEFGTVLFFGMATQFSKAVLGLEGIGKDAHLLMGSGYTQGHAEDAIELVRKNIKLKNWMMQKFHSGRSL